MIVKPFETKINLKNDGRLSLFFIGTGSAFVKNNFQNNLLIIKLYCYIGEYYYELSKPRGIN